MHIGTLNEIWRYPVKSLSGESLTTAKIEDSGIVGDRLWALVDEESGDITNAKKINRLLHLTARYLDEPEDRSLFGANVPAIEITFPDGSQVDSNNAAGKLISEYAGRVVRLHPLEPASNLDHYRMSKASEEADFARQMNIQPGEDAPDFSKVDQKMMAMLMEYACPPGSYFDAYPLHLLTSASLDHMRTLDDADFDVRRFRPNLYVETIADLKGTVEFDWVGKGLRIGGLVLRVDSPTIRCAVPARDQEPHGLGRAPSVSRALYEHTERNLGVNIAVLEASPVSVGDDVSLIDLD